jgi:hypothetical protein
MTTNVSHLNNMMKQLKDQYATRIDYLISKIEAQQNEIDQLNELISLLSAEKNYDC